MRLTQKEVNVIKQTITTFDPTAKIYLFGSRVHDHLKGGDIDLLIISNHLKLEDIIKIKLKLYDAMGEQKIDIVMPNQDNQAFVSIAMKEGILL